MRVVYLEPNVEPDISTDRWMLVEAHEDGRFYGTGAGIASDGDPVFYVSRAENDISMETAISAAIAWAKARGIAAIQVRSRAWSLALPDIS